MHNFLDIISHYQFLRNLAACHHNFVSFEVFGIDFDKKKLYEIVFKKCMVKLIAEDITP